MQHLPTRYEQLEQEVVLLLFSGSGGAGEAETGEGGEDEEEGLSDEGAGETQKATG